MQHKNLKCIAFRNFNR